MSNETDVKLMKWPFFVGDAVLLVFAYFIYARHAGSPMGTLEALLFVATGAMGAALAVTPYLLEYFTAAKLVETSGIVATVEKIENLETVAAQISAATAQWQGVQEHAAKTTGAANEIADRMTAETAAFTEFLKKANDSERTTQRLEIEKLRRAEGEWLEVVVRLLDHVYALNQAAARSGQPGLIEQLGQFQNSCREIARRIGLVPFIGEVNAPFDPKRHETPDSMAMSVADPRVRDTIATGYTYQGRLLRPALVALHNPPPASLASPEPETETALEPEADAAKPEAEAEEPTLL